jgi:hypothetical protein
MDISIDPILILRAFPGFSRLAPDELETIRPFVEMRVFPDGKDIYRRGERGKFIYFVAAGQVHLTQPKWMPQILTRGDIFGEEALLGRQRESTAHAEGELTVVRIHIQDLRQWSYALPSVHHILSIIARSRRLATPARFRWLAPNEIVYLASRKTGYLLLPNLLLPFLLALAGAGSAIAFLWLGLPREWLILSGVGLLLAVIAGGWQTVDWGNDFYLVTNRRAVAIQRVPFIYDDRQETPLAMIQAVSFTSSFSQRLAHCGDVTLRTFTKPLIFPAIPHPELVARLIEDIWKRDVGRNTPNDREEIESILSERLQEEGLESAGSPTNKLESDAPAKLGRMQTRLESGNTITYRKHLFFALRDTFLPILLIATGIALSLFSIIGLFPIERNIGIAIGLAAGFIGVVWAWYEYIDWANDLYQVTSDQILAIHRKPLGDEERRSAALENILSLEYDRPGLLARIFNFGTVTATVGQINFTFEEVQNPVGVQEDIFRRMEGKRQRRSASQRQERREEIATWIETYHRMTHPKPSDTEDPT